MKKMLITVALLALSACAAPISGGEVQALAAISSQDWVVVDGEARRALRVPRGAHVAVVSSKSGINYMLVACDEAQPRGVSIGVLSLELLADKDNQSGARALVKFSDGKTEWFWHDIDRGFVTLNRWSMRDVLRRTTRESLRLQIDDYSMIEFANHKRRGAVDEVFNRCRAAWS